MADVEEPQFTTLAERIAALNKQKNFKSPETKAKRPPPPPPPGAINRSQTLPVEPAPAAPTVTPAPAARPTPTVPPRPARSATPKAPPPALPRRAETFQIEVQPPPPSSAPTPPQLPSRAPSQQTSPALPERRPSGQSQHLEGRRNSNASELSNFSALSLNQTVSSATSIHSVDGSTRKLPPAFDPASLPPLPPTKREREAQAKEAKANLKTNSFTSPKPLATKTLPPPVQPPPLPSVNSAPAVRQIEAPQRPSLPPRLTSRPTNQPVPWSQKQHAQSESTPAKPQLPRRLPPPVIPPIKKQFTTNGQQGGQVQERPAVVRPPIPGTQHQPQPQQHENLPPPIPTSTRPPAAHIETAPAMPEPPVTQGNNCLICRDFSGPDSVAAQYPRESLPRDDPVGYLAHMLCSPFTSFTDKARSIFTWFHHNIAYDCAAFFGNSVRARSPEETISMGRAVCSGYADTYKAIAQRAGLECVTVSGHGKGFGHTALKKGERPPPKKADGHAWNSVRIDNGEWKLLDACWGAGSISGATKSYTADFKPHQFTRSNETFGLTHFPKDDRYHFRSDGRIPTWEEYFIGPVNGETPLVYSNAYQEGIWAQTVSPPEKQIEVYSGACVRFQFSKVCEHWTSEKNGLGKPPLLILTISGRDGRKKDMIPMETDGFWWWVDVNAIDLGAPGESISVVMLSSLDNRDARGVTAQEFLSKRGKVGMSWSGIMKWDLV